MAQKNPNSSYIRSLLDLSKGAHEFQAIKGDELIKIDLKPENLMLWNETCKQFNSSHNLLLSCESSTCDLESTSLTWVVGSAIRPVNLNSQLEAINLLLKLGATEIQSEIIQDVCSGLGLDMGWAFFLDRHELLTASPLLNIEDINYVREIQMEGNGFSS